MNPLVITIHIIACIALVILVLLQSGKEGMGVIFGGGSTSLFGSSGAGGLLTKLTAGAAIVFFATSLTFTYLSTQHNVEQRESLVLDAVPNAPVMEKTMTIDPTSKEVQVLPQKSSGQTENKPVEASSPAAEEKAEQPVTTAQ